MEETVPRLVMKEKIIIFANIKFIDCFIKRGLQRTERPCPRTLSLVRKHEPGYGSPNVSDVSEILPKS